MRYSRGDGAREVLVVLGRSAADAVLTDAVLTDTERDAEKARAQWPWCADVVRSRGARSGALVPTQCRCHGVYTCAGPEPSIRGTGSEVDSGQCLRPKAEGIGRDAPQGRPFLPVHFCAKMRRCLKICLYTGEYIEVDFSTEVKIAVRKLKSLFRVYRQKMAIHFCAKINQLLCEKITSVRNFGGISWRTKRRSLKGLVRKGIAISCSGQIPMRTII